MGKLLPVRVVFAFLFFSSVAALAKPQLQLSQTALFAEAPAQKQTVVGTILAVNVGDGHLKLSLTPSAPWLSAKLVSGGRGCHKYPNASQCFGIQIAVDTAKLTNGVFTGNVDVSPSNTSVAAQNIVVTIVVGGPNAVSVYVAPNGTPGSVSVATDTNTFSVKLWPPVNPSVQLTVVEPMNGSFPNTTRDYEFDLQATAAAGTRDGVYGAAYTINGLASSSEDATVPVEIHVTSQPIATTATNTLDFVVAPGSATAQQLAIFTNRGLGTLLLTKATTDSSWLTATVLAGNAVAVSADASKLATGTYTGSVTVTGNFMNPAMVAARLTVTTPGPPVVTGVAGSPASLLPLGEIVTINGSNFADSAAQSSSVTPVLPTSLAGASVLLGSEAAPLVSVAPSAIAFQVPYDANATTLQVVRVQDGSSNLFPIQIVRCYPVINAVEDATGARLDSIASIPPLVDVGTPITIYGHGFGATVPPAPSGTLIPAPSLFGPSAFTAPVQVHFSDAGNAVFSTMNLSSQLRPGLIGQYQIAAAVPVPPATDVRPALVNLSVQVCGRTSNSLMIRVR